MTNRRFKTPVVAVLALTVLLASCGGPPKVADLGPRELYEVGKQQYDKEKYRRAVDYFQSIVFNFPGNSVVDTAQYYLGLSYFGSEEYELAAIEFNRLALNYPSSEFFENAVFMRAVSVYESTPKHHGLDQTELEQAIIQLEDFLIDFPESELVPDAKKYLNAALTRMAHKYYDAGLVYERIGAPKAARIYFQKVIDDYTDTEYAADATYHYALMELRLKNYDDARRQFENFAAVFDQHELVDEAREKAAEAAFKHCRKSFEEGDLSAARECLVQFKSNYPDNGKIDDADDIIEKIDAGPNEENTKEHAGT